MMGRNPLLVAKEHGHRIITVLTVYAARTEGAVEAEIPTWWKLWASAKVMMSPSMLPAKAAWRLRRHRVPGNSWRGFGNFEAACRRTSSSTGWKPMSAVDPFFDTSVLIYLLSEDVEKADRVEELLAENGVISVQVLNEFTNVSRRKSRLSSLECREVLDTIRVVCETHPLTVESHDLGIEISDRYGLSIYDSMIVASASLAGCETLYSEDLQHRQVIDGKLTVINPFESE
jgi:predicted nucleic acid-binding protein